MAVPMRPCQIPRFMAWVQMAGRMTGWRWGTHGATRTGYDGDRCNVMQLVVKYGGGSCGVMARRRNRNIRLLREEDAVPVTLDPDPPVDPPPCRHRWTNRMVNPYGHL